MNVSKKTYIVSKNKQDLNSHNMSNLSTEEVLEDIGLYKELVAFQNTVAGKSILTALRTEISVNLSTLCGQAKTMPEMEMRVRLSEINKSLAVLHSFTRADKNLDGATEMLKELTTIAEA